MDAFRHKNYRTPLLLGLVIVLSLLCAQGVALHVHDMDHEVGSDSAAESGQLGALSQLHSAYDLSHSEHHDGPVHDVDACPDGILKNISPTLLVLALFGLYFVLLVSPLGSVVFRHCERTLIPLERHLFSPPLRAPPL